MTQHEPPTKYAAIKSMAKKITTTAFMLLAGRTKLSDRFSYHSAPVKP